MDKGFLFRRYSRDTLWVGHPFLAHVVIVVSLRVTDVPRRYKMINESMNYLLVIRDNYSLCLTKDFSATWILLRAI